MQSASPRDPSRSTPQGFRDGTLISTSSVETGHAHRVRHVASIHVRNFRPEGVTRSNSTTKGKGRPNLLRLHSRWRHESNSDAETIRAQQQLFKISIGIGKADGDDNVAPTLFVDPSEAGIHADWTVDPLQLAQAEASTSQSTASSSILGQSMLKLSLWYQINSSGGNSDKTEGWRYCQIQDVDLRAMQRLHQGLLSPSISRLPPNSIIIGLRTSNAAVEGHGAEATAKVDVMDVQQVKHATEGSKHRDHEEIRYYLVPPRNSSRAEPKQRAQRRRSASPEWAGSDPETTIRDSSGEEGEGNDAGYDSETAYELSFSHSPHSDRARRPGLERKSSSSKTVRSLRKGRQKRSSSQSVNRSGSTSTKSRTIDGPDQEWPRSRAENAEIERDRRVHRWQLERQHEKEVLERSKRETTMLSSYDAERLEKLLSTQAELCEELLEAAGQHMISSTMIATNERSTSALQRQISALHGRQSALRELQEAEDDRIRKSRSTIAQKREELGRRKARLDLVKRQLQENSSQGTRGHADISALRKQTQSLHVRLHNRRARLLESLSGIYPIQLVSAPELLFSVCGQAIPNSPAVALRQSAHILDEEEIAAGLGYAAQLVALLSSYLETSLHYEIASAGSRTMIRDGISIMNGPRLFPLYTRGAEMYRFEYGVFLLVKNVEQLTNAHNLPVLDLHHILPNLNNLMLTLSSPVQAPGNTDEELKSNGRPQSQVILDHWDPSPVHRRGYRTTGRGEIILPSTRKDEANTPFDQDIESANGNSNSNGNGNGHVTGGVKDSQPSAAASWTASLLGWGGGGRQQGTKAQRTVSGASFTRPTAQQSGR